MMIRGSLPRSRPSRERGHSQPKRETTTTKSRPPGYAGEAYLALVLELIAEESRGRETTERRAVGVLATIAVIVTVLVTLLGGEGLASLNLGPWATLLGAEAAVVFIFVGLFAWLAIIPRRHLVARITALRRIVESETFWSADPRIGTRRAAESHLTSLETTRIANARKSWNLAVAMLLELVAVALLVASVVAYINGR